MPPFDASPAAAHELLAACRLLFAEERVEYARGRLLADPDASRVFVARASGVPVAATVAQVLPGALAVLWPPRGDPSAARDAALSGALAWLKGRGVKGCQAFAAIGADDETEPLARAGFAPVTQLVFLYRALLEPLAQLDGWTLEAEVPPFGATFRDVLVRTHADSLDCPELHAARDEADIVAGFADPAPGGEWYLVRYGGAPVGVAVLSPGSEPSATELNYIGLVPEARGRGLGAALLHELLARLRATGAGGVSLSVDARNAPAVRAYARHGFAERDRRAVWLARW
jgi:ribosomal protein S18 acetylase RimI-like enzyme